MVEGRIAVAMRARKEVCVRWCRRAKEVEGAEIRCLVDGREAGVAGVA